METVTLKDINELLKDAPKSVLEKVLVYIEDLVADKNFSFELTNEQKKSLLEIKKRPYSEHTEIESFVNDFKSEYGI